MLNRWIFWILTVFSLFFAHVVHAETIGTIVEIEGTVTVAHPGQKAQPAKLQDEIAMQDVITTGPDSRAFILLIDDTEWTLSENARFEVTEYVFNPDNTDDNKARYSVLEGAFRYVSGLVAKKPNPDVTISTPVGSIGIRGTDFSAGTDENGEYGVYVDEGSVNVKNEAGEALLKQGEGTSIKDRRAAPGRPMQWRKERLERMRGQVFLKRNGELKERMQKMHGHQMELRQKFMEAFKQRRGKMQEQRGQRQEKMQELRQQWQENHQGQGQGQQLQERRQQWQENHPNNGNLRQRFRQRQGQGEGQDDQGQ